MTNEVLNFLKSLKEKIGQPKRILEVGSLNINGSAREIFQTPETEYVGIDKQTGKDVDIVIDAHDILDDGRIRPPFDLIICCEMLEHDPTPIKSVDNMLACLKPGGWIIITTPGISLRKHEYPQDYYRYFGQTYKDVFFKGMKNVYVEEFCLPGNPNGTDKPDWIFGYAQK